MMRIEDFPRPKDDNGRGIHWSARLYHNVVQPSLDHWIDELVAMKIKWVKVLDDGGGSSLELCRKLIAADLMPVVRIYLEPANPNHLGGRELETVTRLVEIGARYFESNNEPDLPAEWRDGRMPQNWLEIVVDNFIRDADGVLARGGLLALPAMGPGSRDNPVELVVRKGRQDLFERGCWVAIHNYTLNHPLDYPNDAVNQEGTPLTQEEYDRYAAWAYSHLSYDDIVAQGIDVSRADYDKYQGWAWDNRNLQMVNQLRAERKNPGDTIFDDPNCFRGWEAAGKMIHDALGFHVPVISTEGGPVMGWGDDKRYAKVNPQTQMEWQLGIMRFMQSQAPPWYFACCTWLIAARPLGDFNPTWEQMAWYTHAWDHQFGLTGQLPLVQALKDEPAQIRPELRAGDGLIEGSIARSSGQPLAGLALDLVGEGRQLSDTTDSSGAFRFQGLAAGTYDLLTGNLSLSSGIALAEGGHQTLNLTLAQGRFSTVSGVVADSLGQPRSGLEVVLGRAQEQIEVVRTDDGGHYQVNGLAEGSYWLITGAGEAAVAGIRLDGWASRTVDLTLAAPTGSRFVVAQKRLLDPPETGNSRRFFGQVSDEAGQGMNGVQVEMAWINAAPGTQFPRLTTPKDPFKPPGNFEFLHSPGEFLLRVVDAQWPSDEADGLRTINVPGREGDPISYEVDFQLRRGSAGAGTSQITGTITNGAGLGLTLWRDPGPGESGRRSWATVLPTDGVYNFPQLPAGRFNIELEGTGIIEEVDLAEGSSTTVDYQVDVGPVGNATISGTLRHSDGTPAPGRALLLYRLDLLLTERTSDGAGQFRFSDLSPGSYRLEEELVGVLADPVIVDAGETVMLDLELPPAGGGSTIEGILAYRDGRPAAGVRVWLLTPSGDLIATTAGTDGHFTLTEIMAGTYDLFMEHPSQGQLLLQQGLEVDGLNPITVAFDQLDPPPGPDKPVAAYLLFGGENSELLLEIALPYLRRQEMTGGYSVDEAKMAARVTIVGGEDQISALEEQALREAGCQVERLPGDPFALAEVLQL